jgi:16S rRNA (cytosine1402-N4)-methyltransferase
MENGSHQTVLLHEAVTALEITPNDTVVDATIGGAGHFALLMSKLSYEGTIIGIDADEEAIARAQAIHDAAEEAPRMFLANDNFRNLEEILTARGIEKVNKILFDLGWSGYQLTRGRGFSFQTNEALLMTYGNPETEGTTIHTAEEVVNTLPEHELADMLYGLGEEQFSRQIARGIVQSRKQKPVKTTFELVDIIKASTPFWYHHRRLHPATKTFQALRIYVNDEFGALREGLTAACKRTSPGGRIAVITFHSVEDRIVKLHFRNEVAKGNGSLITKKPIVPSQSEVLQNPRSRSAKLRVYEVCSLKCKPVKNLTNSVPLYA